MLIQRIIALFPSIDVLMAEEASDIIRIDLGRVIEESCFCKLRRH